MAFTENFRLIEFNPDEKIREIFRATQGDTKSQGFNVVVVLGGKKKVITTETMSFFAQKPDGTRVTDMAVKDGDGFKIELKNQVFAVPGVVVCTLVLRGSNGEKLAGRQFKILVAGSMEDGAIISEDEREILDRAFDLATDIVPKLEGLDAQLEIKTDKDYVDRQDALKADKTYTDEQLALKADLSEIEVARGTKPTLGARLDADKAEVSTQLAEKANKQQDAWMTPTLVNGWVEDISAYPFRYRKNSLGELVFTGRVASGSGVIFTLPIGYRPVKNRTVKLINTQGQIIRGSIGPEGNVSPMNSSSNLYFDDVIIQLT